MNAYTSAAIRNLGIVAAVIISIVITHSIWSLLGLLFLTSVGKNKDKDNKDKEEVN